MHIDYSIVFVFKRKEGDFSFFGIKTPEKKEKFRIKERSVMDGAGACGREIASVVAVNKYAKGRCIKEIAGK